MRPTLSRLARKRAVVGLVSGTLLLSGLTLSAAAAAAAVPLACEDTAPRPGYVVGNYGYTGSDVIVSIPAGVSAITIDACGAAGRAEIFAAGGLGGMATATLGLSGPVDLAVRVGQAGLASGM